jgi:RNA polymerase sigma factor (sigma-70 family)
MLPGVRDDEGLVRFLNAAADHRLLSAEEEKSLGRVARRVYSKNLEHACSTCPSCRARHELVNCNIRLVCNIARYYRNRGLPMGDVIQNGILGLDRAARKFDPERNIRFSTYATLWIKQAIQRGLTSGGSAIRLPAHVAGRRAKARAALTRDSEQTLVALAADMDISLANIERALDAAEVVTSLDREMYGDDFTQTMLDGTPDPHAEDPADLGPSETRPAGIDAPTYVLAYVARLDEWDNRVPSRQLQRIIEMSFGLTGKPPMSAEDIAHVLKGPKGKPLSPNTIKTRRAEALDLLAQEEPLRARRGVVDSVA